ncbi:DUF418 domain-containing protein [Rothia nasimurium]|uniref:DUF418 domain-containing protein n=1 Tax=Rothia nasimurium TaxID=85336 RepID=UPI001F2656DD|nr:DUF418 domain-containing protein [Rothia nasimurium]
MEHPNQPSPRQQPQAQPSQALAPQPQPSQAQASSTRSRMLVPDVARGLMLWGIAVANVATAWVLFAGGPASMTGRVVNDSFWDKLTIMFTTSFVHARGFPMFSTLLGFGVGLIAASLYRRGYPLPKARGVIARRYGMLAIFGGLHMVFLFWGDIMLAYGLIGLFMACLIAVRTKVLLWVAGTLFVVTNLVALAGVLLLQAVLGSGQLQELLNGGSGDLLQVTTYWSVLLNGLIVLLGSLLGVPMQAFMLLPLMLLGFVLAREGVLAEPARHRRVLVWLAGVGLAAALGTGIPAGLEALGVLHTGVFGVLTMTLGVLGGPGFIALLALALAGVQERVDAGAPVPAPLRPLIALGKRSMTGYVQQSVIFLVVFGSFALGLFADAGAALLLLVGTGGWLVTVLVAVALEAAGKPGPLEALHRRMSYGKGGLN